MKSNFQLFINSIMKNLFWHYVKVDLRSLLTLIKTEHSLIHIITSIEMTNECEHFYSHI
jgi:hypothetical protein